MYVCCVYVDDESMEIENEESSRIIKGEEGSAELIPIFDVSVKICEFRLVMRISIFMFNNPFLHIFLYYFQ